MIDNRPATLVDALIGQCESEIQGETLYSFQRYGDQLSNECISYLELESRARTVATLLQRWERKHGSTPTALLIYQPGLEYIVSFYACLLAKIPAVPLYPPNLKRHLSRFTSVVNNSGARFALSSSNIIALAKRDIPDTSQLAELQWLATDADEPIDPGDFIPTAIRSEDLAFIQYTSGSTADPKGVMLSHRNLLDNITHITRCFDLESSDTIGASWLPPYHDMGLIGGILSPMINGFPVHLMAPVDFIKQPFRWLDLIGRERVTSSGGPDFSYSLCCSNIPESRLDELDLRSWRIAFTGAEPVRDSTISSFSTRFLKTGFDPAAFFPCYGLAESTLLVAGKSPPGGKNDHFVDKEQLRRSLIRMSRPNEGQKMISNGCVIDSHNIQIVAPDSRLPCEPEQVGEIWIQGASVACGYWRNESLTEELFRATIADNGVEGEFLRTGDMGYLLDGELFITGRLKDMIIIRGQNYYPQDIEQLIERSHESVRSNGVVVFPVDKNNLEHAVVVAEINPKFKKQTQSIETAIFQCVLENQQIKPLDIVLVTSRTVPKTSSGKVQRQLSKKMYEEDLISRINTPLMGDYSTHRSNDTDASILSVNASVGLESINRLLTEKVAELTSIPLDSLNRNTELIQYGMDSITAMTYLHWLEESFGVKLPDDLLPNNYSIAMLADLIQNYNPEQSNASDVSHKDYESLELLSYGQQSLWLQQQMSAESSFLNIGSVVELRSKVDISALEHAMRKTISDHKILNTNITSRDGVPIWIDSSNRVIEVSRVDIKGLCNDKKKSLFQRQHDQVFSLERDPLVRATIYTAGEDVLYVQLVVHHIVADMWSMAIIFADILRNYSSAFQLSKIVETTSEPLDDWKVYRRFSGLQRSDDGEKRIEAQWQQWKERLVGELPVTAYPYARPMPTVQSWRGAELPYQLGTELTGLIKELASELGTTVFVVMLAGFQEFMSACSQDEDILIGSPFSGRQNTSYSNTVGYFINPLPIRSRHFSGDTFRDLVDRTKSSIQHAQNNSALSSANMAMRLQNKGKSLYSTLFTTLFSYLQAPKIANVDVTPFALNRADHTCSFNGIDFRSVSVRPTSVQFDLSVTMGEIGGQLCGSFTYKTDLYDKDTISAMAENYISFVEQLINSPGHNMSEFQLLSTTELAALKQVSLCERINPSEKTVDQLVFEQCEISPDHIALICDGHEITYGQLRQKVLNASNSIVRTGIDKGTLIPVVMGRSINMVIAVLAIMKTGCAYVPLDPEYPAERTRSILSKISTRYLIADQNTENQSYELGTTTTLRIEDLIEERGQYDQKGQPERCVNDLAYVIFTSGSTGEPKGVMVEHRSIAVFFGAMSKRVPAKTGDTLLAVSSLSFDISVLELLWPLTCGLRVVVQTKNLNIDYAAQTSTNTFVQNLIRYRPTHLQCTPSYMKTLLGYDGVRKNIDRLKVMMLGGEVFPSNLAEELFELTRCRIYNMYGPTETTIWSSSHELLRSEYSGVVPIGKPIANTEFFVLDRHKRQLPIGCSGELYIGGDGVTQGYFGDRQLSSDRFIQSPLPQLSNKKIYQTGDIVRYDCTGSLYYQSRSDAQVKIRGHRIEPFEIERCISAINGIKQAAVICDDSNGAPSLRAFVVPVESEHTLSESNMKSILTTKLPPAMIPESIVCVGSFPQTPNGKIDRKELLNIRIKNTVEDKQEISPENNAERVIAALVQNIFELKNISVTTNLFDIGGHSLLLTKLHAELNKSFDKTIPLDKLFEFPTVRLLANHMQSEIHEGNVESGNLSRDRSIKRQMARKKRRNKTSTAIDEI